MTDLATSPAALRQVDSDSNHPGVWRALSFIIVAASAIVVGIWILQSRSASDLAVQNSRVLDVDPTMVFVDDQELPPGASLTVLGIDSRTRTLVDAAGIELEIPSRVASLVALYDNQGSIHGLALVPPGAERNQVVISPTSTARTLLTLSPTVLKANLVSTSENVGDMTAGAEAFDLLVDALQSNSNITGNNREVESALAAILDRVQRRVLSDQGCDSVLNTRATAVTGSCVEPSTAGASVSNEQDRWILAFAGPAPWSQVCAAIAPAGTPGSQISLTQPDCGERALLAAPGPITSSAAIEPAVINRVQIATGVDTWSSYAAPLLDLTGGVAGLNRRDNTHLTDSIEPLVSSVSGLIGQDPGFDSALRTLVDATSPVERHAATIAATRALADAAGGFVDGWDPAASAHGDLLNFYDRVGEEMLVVDRTEFRWTADAAGEIQIGAAS